MRLTSHFIVISIAMTLRANVRALDADGNVASENAA